MVLEEILFVQQGERCFGRKRLLKEKTIGLKTDFLFFV